jgi:hypothetical protein
MGDEKVHLAERIQAIMAAENTMYENHEVLEQLHLTAEHMLQLIEHVMNTGAHDERDLLLNLHSRIGKMNDFLKEIHEFRLALVWYTEPMKQDKNIAKHLSEWLKQNR